jgi:hypothetical protein
MEGEGNGNEDIDDFVDGARDSGDKDSAEPK